MNIFDGIEKIEIDLNSLWKIRYSENGGINEVVAELLNQQDKMLVPLAELNSLNVDLSGVGMRLPENDALSFHFLDSIKSYLQGVIDCRLTLQAAGVELPA